MPRATKDVKKDELESKKKVGKSTTTAKKTTTKSTRKDTVSSAKKKTATKSSTAKKTSTTKATADKATKSSATKKAAKSTTSTKVAKTSIAKKKTTTTKKVAKSTKKKSVSNTKKVEDNVVAEYYDLPYRYNETIVRILYQTPNVLFVYWDISDDDRNKFIKEYGENFFYDTKPVLKVFNLTKNYNFEVEINDFANSWYINVNDANCDYKVELARKPIQFNTNINSDYIYVSSSNQMEFPNDHILLEELPNKINFKNIKTNKITTKDIGTLRLIGINKIYNVHDFYKKLYKDEILDEIYDINLSSSSW